MTNTVGELIRVQRNEPAHIANVIKVLNQQLPHDEVDSFADFLEPIIQLDPQKRPTASELLKHPWLEPKEARMGMFRRLFSSWR